VPVRSRAFFILRKLDYGLCINSLMMFVLRSFHSLDNLRETRGVLFL